MGKNWIYHLEISKKNNKNLFAAKHVISLQHVRSPFMCLSSLEKCLFGFHFLENPGGNGSNENTVSSCPATIPHFLGGKMHKLDKGQNEQEPKNPLVYHPSISHPKHCSTSRAQSAPEWARPLNWSRVPQAAAKLRKSAKKQCCAYGETNSANWSKISGRKILRSRSNHCLKNIEKWTQLLKQPAHKQWDSMMI